MSSNGSTNAWSTSQLVEYLAVLSEQPDQATARRAAVERVLESLDAEIGVLSGPDFSPVVVGLRADDPQVAKLLAAVSTDRASVGSRSDGASSDGAVTVHVDGLGPCRTVMIALNAGAAPTELLVARAGGVKFELDEMLLLRGMAWVLALALRPLRIAAELGERQRVLDHVAAVQKAVAGRTPLPELFDTVTQSLIELSGADLATLHVADRDGWVLASGNAASAVRPQTFALAADGIAQQVYASEELVRTSDCPRAHVGDPAPEGDCAAMGIPVRENGIVVGSLAVVSLRPGNTFTDAHEQTLRTFADQVSVAMSDARSLATAQHAIRDPVTGLPNRMYFMDVLQRALDNRVPVHVLFLDLDRFKLVNDTHGHAVGDDLLRRIGRRLRETLRSGDLLARFGGDEYAVLMERASDDAVRECGDGMLAAVQSSYLVGADDVVVGGSIGVASGEDRATAGDVMRDADTAMYRAKHAGGGRVMRFEQPMRIEVVQRCTIETDLRHAVNANTLHAAYQPVVELHGEQMQAAEALARWDHPTRGCVPPTDFVPLAEETGLIIPLGRSILATACAEAAAWPALVQPNQPPDVSVNISTRQMLDTSFVADVRQILTETGLDPRRLVLEITESTLVSDLDGVLDVMHRLRDLGIRLAIDDFGTGYSSLSYLRMFPVDILKIDRSFVESIGAPWHGTAFIRAIVRLTEALSITAVAEGVETPAQARALREVGCHIGQGYLFAKPMSASEFASYARVHAVPVAASD